MSWNPLFSSLLTSSLLSEGPDVVAVWALLVASADRYGESDLTPPVVASLLRIPTERAAAAFGVLASPDVHSRTRLNEGRRIVHSDDGKWFLPSHAKHRTLMAREKANERQARYRERLKAADRDVCRVVGCEREVWATTSAGVPVCSEHSSPERDHEPEPERAESGDGVPFDVPEGEPGDDAAFADHDEAVEEGRDPGVAS